MSYSERSQPQTAQRKEAPSGQGSGAASQSAETDDDEASILDILSASLGAALGAGGSCALLTQRRLRVLLIERLRAQAIDVERALGEGRIAFLDVESPEANPDVLPGPLAVVAEAEPMLARARQARLRPSAPLIAVGGDWQDEAQSAELTAAVRQAWGALASRYGFSIRGTRPGVGAEQDGLLALDVHCGPTPVPRSRSHSSEERRLPGRVHSGMLSQSSTKGPGTRLRAVPPIHVESLAEVLLEHSADCVCLIDLDGRVKTVSTGGERRLLADESKSLPGSIFAELWDAEDRPRVEAALAAALMAEPGGFTAELPMGGGKGACWEVRIAPVPGAQRQVVSLVALCSDVTEMRRAHAAAIEAERQAVAGRLAATIAHEINNPLEAATNLIYLAKSGDALPPAAQEFLSTADSELARAGQIARQMLGFYRTTARVRWSPVEELVQGVLAIFARKFEARQVTPLLRVDPRLEIYGKEGELRQMLVNLVGNALDAVENNGRVWIRATAANLGKSGREPSVRITVADDGHGMAPDTRERIFKPFFTTKGGRGTGIGLWITKSLVDQHQGSLRFRSREGERSGTVMTIVLPKGRIMTKRAEVA